MQTNAHGTSARRPVPAGAGAHPRWLSPAIAAAMFDLQELAPRLSSLLYVRVLPDATVQAILDWSEEASSDAGKALTLDRLRAVFPALVTAFVGAHTYSRADPGEDGGLCVDLHDQGCGALVGAMRSRLELIAMALHGEEGRRLVAATHADLADHLDRIARLVMAR